MLGALLPKLMISKIILDVSEDSKLKIYNLNLIYSIVILLSFESEFPLDIFPSKLLIFQSDGI